MKKVILIIILSICSVLDIQSQEFVGDKDEIQQILKNIKGFSESYMAANYDALAESYAENAKILPPGSYIIEGKESIRKRWILPEGVKILYHKIDPLEIKIIGNHAYDIGYYQGKTLLKNGEETSWKGKYLIVWIKEKGLWKIYADAWNRIDSDE